MQLIKHTSKNSELLDTFHLVKEIRNIHSHRRPLL